MKISTIAAALTAVASLAFAEAAQSKKPGRTFGTLSFGGGKELMRCRLDPIVNPGGVAPHMHSIFGGNAFGASMPGDTAETASCTNANVKNDHSNYWVPSLFFKSPENGTLYPVELFYAKVYYFFEATNDDIKPFPKGFRMRAGDPSLRRPPSPVHGNLDSSKGAITPVQWTCPRDDADSNTPLYPPDSDGTKGVGVQDPTNGGQGWGFPDKECNAFASPLRGDIHFPSCVNPNVAAENWKENTAYPSSNGMSGEDCPPGWIHVPHVFMEVYWNTLKFENMWEKGKGHQPWVLSNGDTTGYSLHADFVNGWDSNTLAYLIDNCDPQHAGLASCPGLPGGETSEEEMKACKLKCPLQEGSADGYWQPMPNNKLLGNNQLSGYQAAAYVAPGGSGSAPAPVVSRPATSVKPASVPTTTAKPANVKPTTTVKAVPPAPKPTTAPAYIPSQPSHPIVKSTRVHTTVMYVTVKGNTSPATKTTSSAKPKKTCSRGRKHSRHGSHRHRVGSH